MTEFWESSFKDNQAMWGFDPVDSARDVANAFLTSGFKNILIPGFGYGRNADVFTKNGFHVTGIEISKTAIALAKKQYGESVTVVHGSVCDMPFDQYVYDGIFCYALIHLLDANERVKLIADCYNQLKKNGLMVFVAISTNDTRFGKGEYLMENQYLTAHGVKLFFYNSASIENEFGKYGLIEAKEINEPSKPVGNNPVQRFWKITCRK